MAFDYCIIDSIETRDVAQPGSASALGAEGPRFESLYPDHEFEQCGISSVVERHVYTVDVGSSTLSSRTIFILLFLCKKSIYLMDIFV